METSFTIHPENLPNEIKGKGPNIAYASEEARKLILDRQGIKYEDVMTLRSLEKYLEEAGFDDVRELTVDDEVVDYPEKDSGGLVRLIESGGFIAFKPKK